MPPDYVKGRPSAGNRGNGLNTESVTNTTTIVAGNAASTGHSPSPRLASAATWEPCGRRGLWVGIYECPWCDGGHVARARTEGDLAGPRRSGCGRPVVLTPGGVR
jgi:hypothetical protein